MNCYGLSRKELQNRRRIAQRARGMISAQLLVDGEDDTSLMAAYKGFYLQVSFSSLHPLMVICLARALEEPDSDKWGKMANELNLGSVLGCHTVNEVEGCYVYRAACWLDKELEPCRFFEILERCMKEAERGYQKFSGFRL